MDLINFYFVSKFRIYTNILIESLEFLWQKKINNTKKFIYKMDCRYFSRLRNFNTIVLLMRIQSRRFDEV